MDVLVIDAAAREHSEIIDRPGAVLWVGARALDQLIGGLLVPLPPLQSKINIRIGIARAKILGELRAPLQLLHAIGHLNAASPGFELLIEEFQRAHIVTDGAFEQLLRLRLCGKSMQAIYVSFRQGRCEDARRNYLGCSWRRCCARVVCAGSK